MLSNRSIKIDNQLLKLSIKQDLKNLDDLNHTISLNQQSSTMNSWLHPNQSIVYQPEFIVDMKIDTDDDYMNCLELIIDRIYSILGVCLNILETTKPKNILKNIIKPQKMTLSLIIKNLYETIENITNIKTNTHLRNENKPKSPQPESSQIESSKNLNNKEIQVNINNPKCTSCTITLKCIKTIADELSNLEGCFVAKAKDKMKSSIFTSSQEDSVNLLTNAINKDVRDLIKRNRELEEKLNELKDEMDAIDISHQDSLIKIENLEKDINSFEEYKTKEQQKQSILHSIINKLLKDKKKTEEEMKWHKDQIKQLEGVLESQTANIKELHEELENFKTDNKRLLSQEELLNIEKALWKTRYDRAEEENKRSKKQNDHLLSNTERIGEVISSIEETYNGLQENISESCCIIEENFNSFKDLFNQIEDVVKSSTILNDNINNYAQNLNSTTTDIKVKGDPLLDMMKQIEQNDENIAKMKQQNQVLLKIVQKFQENAKKIVNNK